MHGRILFFLPVLCAVLSSSGSDSSAPLTGIAHVAFRVSDVKASRELFENLGFEQAFAFADPGKPPVSYIKINDHEFIELYGRADDSQPLGLMHVCYEVSDIQALWNDYARRGLTLPQPKKARAGNLLSLLHDPAGQIVEYTQYLPGSLHFEDRGKHLSDRRISQRLIRAVMPVQDLREELRFYTEKLGFENVGDETSPRLRLPGNSSEELHLAVASPRSRPQIVFAVRNLDRAASELRSRKIPIEPTGSSITVTDPDGTRILFLFETGSRQP